jgi:hypothetical protein
VKTYALALAPALALSTSVPDMAHTMYNRVAGLKQKVEGSIGLVQQRFKAQDEESPCEADIMTELVMPCSAEALQNQDFSGCSGVCATYLGEVMAVISAGSGSSSMSMSERFDAIYTPMCREVSCLQAIVALEEKTAASAECIAAGGAGSGSGTGSTSQEAGMEEILEFMCAIGPNGDTCASIIFGNMFEAFEHSGSGSGSAAAEIDECTVLADVGCCLASFANMLDGEVDFSNATSTCGGALTAATVPCESPFEDRTFLATTLTIPGCTVTDVGELQTDLSAAFGCPAAQSSVSTYTASDVALILTFRCETTSMVAATVTAVNTAMGEGVNPTTDLPLAQANNAACGGTDEILTAAVQQTQAPGGGSSPASALVVSGFVMAGLALF